MWVEVREQHVGIHYLLPLCGTQSSHSAHQTWWQLPAPAAPSHWPTFDFFICASTMHIQWRSLCLVLGVCCNWLWICTGFAQMKKIKTGPMRWCGSWDTSMVHPVHWPYPWGSALEPPGSSPLLFHSAVLPVHFCWEPHLSLTIGPLLEPCYPLTAEIAAACQPGLPSIALYFLNTTWHASLMQSVLRQLSNSGCSLGVCCVCGGTVQGLCLHPSLHLPEAPTSWVTPLFYLDWNIE